jgi:PqqD family protein of HPr-rel-A system
MPVSSKDKRPKGNAKGQDLGDEYLIYDSSSDDVHVLKGTARDIFLLCDGSHTAEQIASALVEEYEVDRTTARRDTERTLRELSDLGALDWS